MPYCAQPGCPMQVARGRCPSHARLLEQQRPNRVVRRWYYTARWARLRAQVLVAACYTCAVCGFVQLALDVDHIRKHNGDPQKFWDRANLQALCSTCHAKKTKRGE